MRPWTALELEGRDIYIREGCHVCHTQMVRPLRAEVERYGPYSRAAESTWDHPFLWGSKRTGPDLARVGGRYSDQWHVDHLIDPRSVVPDSVMPAYPWLAKNEVDGVKVQQKCVYLKTVLACLIPKKTSKQRLTKYKVRPSLMHWLLTCSSLVSPCRVNANELGRFA